MPTYGNENFKESNVNYLNKDFTALKTSLMNYAKSYFPDTYRDFNETSPGMMLLEMNAYVGDVLSFYVDQQYREMLLPLAEERRNIITMAKMFGYKVKPIVPAYVDLTFTSNVNASSGDVSKVDYSNAGTFDAGIEIVASSNEDIIFTTLEPIDFRITGSNDTETIGSTDSSGLASTYTLSRTVKAVSATEKTITFQVGVPEKFKKLTIPDTNVVDIISCVDSNNNKWYEVDYLAQDKVPISTHYTEDVNRETAYMDFSNNQSTEPVPYSLTYITTGKRFTRETNLDNTTSLIFGNGVLKNGQVVNEGFIDMEQVGIVIPGQTNDLNQSISPELGDEYSTLGETPNNITLTITYRVGGGVESNVISGDINTDPSSIIPSSGDLTARLASVTNNSPARGGKDEEDTLEIKEKARAFFSTQNRCVTKEDYEARVMNVPAKYGNIAKVYVARSDVYSDLNYNVTLPLTEYITSDHRNNILNLINQAGEGNTEMQLQIVLGQLVDVVNSVITPTLTDNISSINIYVLGYNNRKQLIGNPHINTTLTDDNLPNLLMSNIKNYLDNFKLMTDFVTINDGYIVNFGVFFDVIAEKYADKQKVKLDCIQKIKDYFKIEKMQFNQPIYKSQLEFELMGVEGVRSIGHVTITQDYDYFYPEESGEGQEFGDGARTYRYSYSTSGTGADINGDGIIDGGFIDQAAGEGTIGYGYKYNFKNALSDDGTIIVPPNTATPTVFELKNPNQNIQGRVR